MRIGAILAKGGRRARPWTARFGAALALVALGAGPAAAQVTVEAPESVNEGGRATLDVSVKVLIRAGAARATVTLTPDVTAGVADEDEGLTEAEDSDYQDLSPLRLTIPANTGDSAIKRTVEGRWRLQTNSDNDAEDEAVTVFFDIDRDPIDITGEDGETLLGAPQPVDITIDDTDEQTFEWDLRTPNPKEGDEIEVTLEAVPAPDDAEYPTTLRVDKRGYFLDADEDEDEIRHTFTVLAPSVSLTIRSPDQDGDRDDDTVPLRAFVGRTTTDRIDRLEIEVADIHALPAPDRITAEAFLDDDGDRSRDEAASVVEGGDPVHLRVTVDRGATGYPEGEELEVAVRSAPGQALDWRVDPGEVEVDSGTGERTADFRLWALADDDVGAEDLVLDLVVTGATAANGPGESVGTFTIAIDDETEPQVTARDETAIEAAIEAAIREATGGERPLNPGDAFELAMTDVFDPADDVDVSYSASVRGGAVGVTVGGEAVTVAARSPGESEVTLTATATPTGSSAVVTRQDRANVAQATFSVAVEAIDLADLVITLSGPEDANLVEGRSYSLTATADRAPDRDLVVELVQTDGGASPVDYEVEPVTIAAGETAGTTLLTVVEDDTAEDGGETLVLEGRYGAEKTGNTLRFHLWDAAVPVLPLLAQLLLAALLALGGYRRYRRR